MRKRLLIAGGLTVFGLLMAAVIVRFWPPGRPPSPPDDDPRLTYPTLYRNVRPDVKYVGDAACAACHADQFEGCRSHPMGRFLAPMTAPTIEKFDAAAHNPLDFRGLRYSVERRGEHTVHVERAVDPAGKTITTIEAEVKYACGSGARARSYFVDRDGFLFQSPLSWFPQKQRWDMSPGYDERNSHFDRAVTPACLFCHCSRVEQVPDTVNRYREPVFSQFGVGCERCHGPGELHVRRRERGDAVGGLDDTIVNPARLDHELREDICRQCHLQGEQRVVARGRAEFDFRPGLPLHLFQMDFIDGRAKAADFKFVNSVEQLRDSRCYAASREPNKLGCTTCHDPHRQPKPEEVVPHYRRSCLKCHSDESCSVPRAERLAKQPDDSCIACHMPRGSTEVQHAAVTDHRILRRPLVSAGVPPPRPTAGPGDLVPFQTGWPAADVERNLGLAQMAMLDHDPPAAAARRYAEAALPRLEAALARDPHDWPALEEKAVALWVLGRTEDALTLFEMVLDAKPESELTLQRAGGVALDADRAADARDYYQRAIRVNPWRWHYHLGRATALGRLSDWGPAADECRRALELEPTSAPARSRLVQIHLAEGRMARAKAEYDTLSRLTPPDRRADLQAWFDQQRRQFGK
ncbi:MAG: tetratricopeptide repeat protein [Gemmataceae bacterium]